MNFLMIGALLTWFMWVYTIFLFTHFHLVLVYPVINLNRMNFTRIVLTVALLTLSLLFFLFSSRNNTEETVALEIVLLSLEWMDSRINRISCAFFLSRTLVFYLCMCCVWIFFCFSFLPHSCNCLHRVACSTYTQNGCRCFICHEARGREWTSQINQHS